MINKREKSENIISPKDHFSSLDKTSIHASIADLNKKKKDYFSSLGDELKKKVEDKINEEKDTSLTHKNDINFKTYLENLEKNYDISETWSKADFNALKDDIKDTLPQRGKKINESSNSDQAYIGTDKKDFVLGGKGDDLIDGGKGSDKIVSGRGNDFIIGHLGDDYLAGGMNKDSLFGGEGKDILKGENGNDILEGGLGRDELYGGWGKDKFVFATDKDSLGDIQQKRDIIHDFSKGVDKIALEFVEDITDVLISSVAGMKNITVTDTDFSLMVEDKVTIADITIAKDTS